MNFAIAGVEIAVLIVGLVEFSKKFGLSGNTLNAVAFGLGVVLTAIAYGIDQALIPAVAVPYVEWAIVAVAGGPAAMGYYDLGRRFLSRDHAGG